MANNAGYQEMIKLARSLGYYDHNNVKRDLKIDRQVLSRENAPTSYSFALYPTGTWLFLQGELGHILTVADYLKHGYPLDDYHLYIKREGSPATEEGPMEVYLFLCEMLDVEHYRAMAQEAMEVWGGGYSGLSQAPANWPDHPKAYAERCVRRYVDALDQRDQAARLTEILLKAEERKVNGYE